MEKFIGENRKIITSSNSKLCFLILIATEKGDGLPGSNPSTSSSSLSNMSGNKAKDLPSFWVPAMTPDAKPVIIPKPSTDIYCPVSGKMLKIKDLIDVKFTLAPKDDDERGKALISRQVRYMCPITRGKCHIQIKYEQFFYNYEYVNFPMPDILSNSVPCTILKPT